ncbi:hypothetical protein ABZ490_23975 [Streptomyces sp. NPDC005811]|uniref:hypothetical protein n=1 Tax=Streptomyces sp. NPDC005811 TaxID=3154565 RepID=UPI0033BFCEE9
MVAVSPWVVIARIRLAHGRAAIGARSPTREPNGVDTAGLTTRGGLRSAGRAGRTYHRAAADAAVGSGVRAMP